MPLNERFETFMKKRKKNIAFVLCFALVAVAVGGTLMSFAGDPETKPVDTTTSGAITSESSIKSEDTDNTDNGEDTAKEESSVTTPKATKTKGGNTSVAETFEEEGEDESSFLSRFTLDAKGETITGFNEGQAGSLYSSKKLVIPEEIKNNVKIKNIGNNAFTSLSTTNVTEIVVPDSVTSIGSKSFYNLKKLTTITLSENLETIGGSAFSDSGLTSVTIPSKVKVIPGNAFHQCASLEKVSLPDGITSIDNNAFKSNTALTNFNFPAQLKVLGTEVFSNTPLKSIDLSNTKLTSIGRNCFTKTNSKEEPTATEVKFPNTLQTIDSGAFSERIVSSPKVTVSIPTSVKTIGVDAFNQMKNGEIDLRLITSGAISNSRWGANLSTDIVWKDTDDSCYYIDGNGMIIGLKPSGHTNCKDKKLHTDDRNLVIPAKIGNKDITGIAAYAFQNDTKIVSLKFEDNDKLKSIKAGAFAGCGSLSEIEMCNSIETIETNAFKSTHKLSNVVWSNKLKTIEAGAFHMPSDNFAWKEIILPDSVETIAANSFYRCNPTTLKLSENLKSIGSNAFYFTRSLRELTIPASVEKIDASAFPMNSIVKVIIKGSNNLTIGSGAFSSSTLKDIYITGRALDSVAGSAWGAQYAYIHWSDDKVAPEVVKSEDGLWSVNRKQNALVSYNGNFLDENKKVIDPFVIPSKITDKYGLEYDITHVNSSTLSGSKVALNKVIFSEGIVKGGQSHFSGVTIKELILPKSMKSLDNSGISGKKLEKIVFPENSAFSQFHPNVFNTNNLTSLDLPVTVSSIGIGAFANNKLQGVINIPGTITTFADSAFTNNPSITAIYIDAYKTAVPVSVRNNAPFGAKNAEVLYKGEVPETTTESINSNNRERQITFTSNVPADEPNYISLYVEGSEDINLIPDKFKNTANIPQSKPFSVYENGKYRVVATNIYGEYYYDFEINDIGLMEMSASDTSFCVLSGGAITEKQIINGANVSAIDLDSKSTDAGITYQISDSDLKKVNSLKKAGQSTTVAITAKYIGTYPKNAPRAGVEYVNSTKTSITVSLAPKNATVNFYGNGGTPEFEKKTATITDGFGISLGSNMVHAPLKKGHEFVNWLISGTAIAFDKNTQFAKDLDVVAQWNKAKYNIEFDLNNGTGTTPSAQSVTYEEFAKTPTESITRTGYIFDGWYTSKVTPANPLSGKKWDFDVDQVTDNAILYAGFKTYDYPVTFNGNSGTVGGNDTTTASVKSPQTNVGNNMPVTTDLLKEHFTFEGWSKNPNGTKADFFGNTEVTEPTTVYAIWSPNVYKIKYDTQGADTTPSDQAFKAPELIAEDTPTAPAMAGYTFKGWNTEKDGTGEEYKDGYKVTKSQTVFAQWEKDAVPTPEGENPDGINNVDNNEGSLGGGETATPEGNGNGTAGNSDLNSGAGSTNTGSNSMEGDNSSVAEADNNSVKSTTEVTRGPELNIGNSKVPMYGEGTWALINLILAAVGVALIVISAIAAARKKEKYKGTSMWLITSAVLALLGIIIVVLTQNLDLEMALVDSWTIVNVVLLAFEIVATVLGLKKKDEKEDYDNPSFQ